jgi:hypothetical protein
VDIGVRWLCPSTSTHAKGKGHPLVMGEGTDTNFEPQNDKTVDFVLNRESC